MISYQYKDNPDNVPEILKARIEVTLARNALELMVLE